MKDDISEEDEDDEDEDEDAESIVEQLIEDMKSGEGVDEDKLERLLQLNSPI